MAPPQVLVVRLVAALVMSCAGACPCAAWANPPQAGGDIPASFAPADLGLDYIERHVDIPMRDGVSLHAVIIIAKQLSHAPAMLVRTPYNAEHLKDGSAGGATLESRLSTYLSELARAGYIIVAEDVRGKHHSGGDFIMTAPLNPEGVDESTDAYDTIDWLATHLAEGNGQVGVIGTSYSGYTALMSLVGSHPALGAVVAMNPMVDGWRGDDWFHNGAFRQQNLPYIYEQEATRSNDEHWNSSHFDDYDMYMSAVSAGELGRRRNMDSIGFWKKITEHPAYDDFWSEQAMDKVLARQPLTVPTMLVAGLWDQEDIYGAMAVYRALQPANHGNLFLVLGPWFHGQEIGEASSLGAIRFESNTGLYFRTEILVPFLAHYLKDDSPPMAVAPVTAFLTGANRWERLQSWPSGCESGCKPAADRLYLQADGALSFQTPAAVGYDEYVSDPAKPVPFRARPIQPIGYTAPLTWIRWLVDDQREFSGRTDVLSYSSEVLQAPLQVSGEPMVHLVASTSGTDVDWVVKLIDVFPDEVPGHPELGGYQLAVAMDIFRGRYRRSLAKPAALESNKPLPYEFALPTTNHVFLPGHKLMVQVQSSWFPLYDRNPQTYVDNIFFAQAKDYKKATERVYRGGADKGSFLSLPVVAGGR